MIRLKPVKLMLCLAWGLKLKKRHILFLMGNPWPAQVETDARRFMVWWFDHNTDWMNCCQFDFVGFYKAIELLGMRGYMLRAFVKFIIEVYFAEMAQRTLVLEDGSCSPIQCLRSVIGPPKLWKPRSLTPPAPLCMVVDVPGMYPGAQVFLCDDSSASSVDDVAGRDVPRLDLARIFCAHDELPFSQRSHVAPHTIVGRGSPRSPRSPRSFRAPRTPRSARQPPPTSPRLGQPSMRLPPGCPAGPLAMDTGPLSTRRGFTRAEIPPASRAQDSPAVHRGDAETLRGLLSPRIGATPRCQIKRARSAEPMAYAGANRLLQEANALRIHRRAPSLQRRAFSQLLGNFR